MNGARARSASACNSESGAPTATSRAPRRAAASAAPSASGLRPDALLCLNDQLALGALRALHEHGVRVPEDVAVIGFDDVEGGRYSVPTLSTVAPDKAAVAKVAVQLLQHRIEEAAGPEEVNEGAESGVPPQDRIVAHRLVLRESTEGHDRR